MSNALDRLAAALAERRSVAEELDAEGQRQAAVAMILRPAAAEREILLMRRVVNPDDRWSGQISLPGGHFESGDSDLATTARRETQEEIGVDLERSGRLLGAMGGVQAKARGRIVPTRITPFVFALTEEVSPVPGPEADEAFWFPLGRAETGQLDEEYRYTRDDGVVRKLPSWRFDDRVVWGLTYFMLEELLTLLRRVDAHGSRAER